MTSRRAQEIAAAAEFDFYEQLMGARPEDDVVDFDPDDIYSDDLNFGHKGVERHVSMPTQDGQFMTWPCAPTRMEYYGLDEEDE